MQVRSGSGLESDLTVFRNGLGDAVARWLRNLVGKASVELAQKASFFSDLR